MPCNYHYTLITSELCVVMFEYVKKLLKKTTYWYIDEKSKSFIFVWKGFCFSNASDNLINILLSHFEKQG